MSKTKMKVTICNTCNSSDSIESVAATIDQSSERTITNEFDNQGLSKDIENGIDLTKGIAHPKVIDSAEQSRDGCLKRIWESHQMGIIMAIASSFSFSICSIVVKAMEDMHPIALATYRFLGLFLLSFPLLLYYKQNPFPCGKRKMLVLRSVLGCMSLMSQFYALKQMPLGDATVITFSVPVFVAIFARIFLKEKFTYMNALTIVLTLTGCLLIARPSIIFGEDIYENVNATSRSLGNASYIGTFEEEATCLNGKHMSFIRNFTSKRKSPCVPGETNPANPYPNMFWGAIVAFSGTIFAANVYVVVRKLKGLHHSTIMTCFGFFAFIQSFSIIAILDVRQLLFDPEDIYWIVILAIFSFFGQILLTMALKREQAGPVSVARSVTIIWAFLWQVFIFDEHPVLLTLLGAALVLVSVVLLACRKWVESKPEGSATRNRFRFLLI
ncbi:solute carrier family 35 member G1-like isoform X2 [Artemia franciscana]|uniref:solute carrier family 35 member G1-like isoform X2 n=1 Tax=Artemia franciscana TaxID=6661 RepID=UPI0032D9BD22